MRGSFWRAALFARGPVITLVYSEAVAGSNNFSRLIDAAWMVTRWVRTEPTAVGKTVPSHTQPR